MKALQAFRNILSLKPPDSTYQAWHQFDEDRGWQYLSIMVKHVRHRRRDPWVAFPEVMALPCKEPKVSHLTIHHHRLSLDEMVDEMARYYKEMPRSVP